VTALALIEALEELAEATVATLPGSVGNRQGKRLVAGLTRALQEYFERIQRRFPTAKVLSFAGKYMAARPEGQKQAQAEKVQVRGQVEKVIGPAVTKRDTTLERVLAEHMAVGYTVAADQIEASLRKQFRIRESGLQEASIRAEFLDQPIPIPIIDWARAESATLVTAMAETTQRDLAGVIADAMTNPRRGVPDVGRAIRERFTDMTRERAELIANTEMNNAMSQGTVDRGASMGAKEKEWITVGDDRVSELICEPNGGQGNIPLAKAFQSGHMQPSGHPRCRCAIATFGATRATARVGVSPEGRSNWLANVGNGIAAAQGLQAIIRAAG